MNTDQSQALYAIKEAHRLLRQGDRVKARYWAEKAASLAPEREEPWLLLAALVNPRSSVAHLKHALEINPQSQRAREGMHWAIKRLRQIERQEPTKPPKQILVHPIDDEALVRSKLSIRTAFLPLVMVGVAVLAIALFWFDNPTFTYAFSSQDPVSIAQIGISKATRTPTATSTFTPTPTFTPTFTPSPTFTPTETPTSTPTETPVPTDTPIPGSSPEYPILPRGVQDDERWIGVSLSAQRTYAYEGNQLIRTFIVSTGTWRTPTIPGTFKIYVKYRYANMSGPGYFLPNVPFVMYYYQSYGIHGTYWHDNFGTPMSAGCINLTIEDAEWLYGFASIGTVIHIYP